MARMVAKTIVASMAVACRLFAFFLFGEGGPTVGSRVIAAVSRSTGQSAPIPGLGEGQDRWRRAG